MMKNLRQSKGITLIALVITIIVLLILAGVAISMLAGENGIITKTNSAKTENENATVEEQVKLAVMAALATGNGEIKGTDAFKALNDGLDDAGYSGEIDGDTVTWPVTVTIGDTSLVISQSGTVSEPPSIEGLKESGKVVTENTTLIADDNLSITIPENFKLSASSPTEVIKGMIIEDSQANQYVWIPVVEKSDTFTWGVEYPEGTTETSYDAIETALKKYTNPLINNGTYTYGSSTITDEWYGDASYGKYGYYTEDDTAKENLIYYTNGNMTKDEYNTLYHNMLTSVYKNKGFYIGRYEMGIGVATSADDEGDDTSATSLARDYSSKEYAASSTNETNKAPTIIKKDETKMSIPVSKANAVGYTYITQSQAQMLAEELGKGADYSKVTSSIMFGVQWDAVCVFIEHFDTKNTITTESEKYKWLTSKDYSKLWGNYKTSEYTLDKGFYSTNYGSTYLDKITTAKDNATAWLYTTGAVEKNSSLNIYDFAGNLAEWTLEAGAASYPCVSRGGDYSYSNYASSRSNTSTYGSGNSDSSRATLYIK